MDAKDIKGTKLERLTKFIIINIIRCVIVGVFNLVFCWFPIAIMLLFFLITDQDPEVGFFKYFICYLISFIYLFWYLVIKNDKINNNRV